MTDSDPKKKRIRDAIKNVLIGNTAAGQNVYSNRVSAYWSEELPSISVFCAPEEKTPRDVRNRQYLRNLEITIETRVESDESLDDAIDRINEQIEELLIQNQTLGGEVQGLVLLNDTPGISGEAVKPVGISTLSISVKYSK